MNTALLNTLSQATDEGLSNGAWLMFAFGSMFLYGGLVFGIVRAIRGKLPYPQYVLEKAADVGWLVALGTLAAVGYIGRQLQGGEHELHILVWIVIYVAVCVPLAILCRHLVIVHYRLTQRREPVDETGAGGTTD